jgi:hypothetical protein
MSLEPGRALERKIPIVRLLLIVLALATGACASVAPSFRVYGTRGDLEQLLGKWDGEYVGSREHGRRGSIAFDLVAGDDHAHGTVLMMPEGSRNVFRRFEPGRPDEGRVLRDQTSTPDTLLTIRFVWVSRGVIEGVLDPYWDPDRATAASTTFTGHAARNSIEGTFVTQYANRAPSTRGSWSVSRK